VGEGGFVGAIDEEEGLSNGSRDSKLWVEVSSIHESWQLLDSKLISNHLRASCAGRHTRR
jgi:hypothetical protein